MKYKLIAMDLDGTLNNDQKVITEKTKEALMAAQRKGIRLALASARPSPGLFKERDILRLQDYQGVLMSYNGGRIVDAASGNVLFETSMDLQQTKQVLRKLEALPVTPILDDGVQFFVADKNGYKVDYECRNNNMVCSEVGNLADFLTFAPIKILMSVQPEELAEVQKQIADFLPDSLTVVQTAAFYLEVIPKVINKGQGIRDICSVLGIDPSEVISFGDAANDIPMLVAAGMGVAMGNASEAVKEAADMVTLSNNEDGLQRLWRNYCKKYAVIRTSDRYYWLAMTAFSFLCFIPIHIGRFYIPFLTGGSRSCKHAGYQSQHGVEGNQRRTAVTDERQGQTDNRGDTDAHTHITGDLEDQSGGSTETDQTAQIVLTSGTHPNDTDDDGKQGQYNQSTADEAQLFTDCGKDIVRMLSEKSTFGLRSVTLEQTLTGHAAAGKGAQRTNRMVTGAGTQGVKVGIEQNFNTQLLVFTQEIPKNREEGNHGTACSQKPKGADTAAEGHTDEDENKDQGNAQVAGNTHIQTRNQSQMQHHEEHGTDRGNSVLERGHDRSHNQNIGDLADFRRLNIDGQEGEVQPASVTGVIVCTEGDQHQKQHSINDNQPIPVL